MASKTVLNESMSFNRDFELENCNSSKIDILVSKYKIR